MARNLYQYPKTRRLPVYRCSDFVATSGANERDAFTCASELVLGDTYSLTPGAEMTSLSVFQTNAGHVIANESEAGHCKHRLHPDSLVSIMDNCGTAVDILVLLEVDTTGVACDLFLMPLSPLQAKREYGLIHIQTGDMAGKLADTVGASFARGTRLTLGSGQQRAVEDLRPGDMILTRDNGAQALREVTHHTHRATGIHAPIRIAARTLGNENDLVMSPEHRLFFCHHRDGLAAGQSEVKIHAGLLLNGDSVSAEHVGYTDYVELLFDRPQIVYAEGVAVEAAGMDAHVAPVVKEDIYASTPEVNTAPRAFDTVEVSPAPDEYQDAIELPRRASHR